MNYVVRELYEGKWVNTYFEKMGPAKKLANKILRFGGVAICLRSAL